MARQKAKSSSETTAVNTVQNNDVTTSSSSTVDNDNDNIRQPITFYTLSLVGSEVVFALMEFIFGLIIIKGALTSAYTRIHGIIEDEIPMYNQFLIHICVNIIVVVAVTWRLSARLQVKSLPEMTQKLGLNREMFFSRLTWSNVTLSVIVLHSLGFCAMMLAQSYWDTEVFSTANYFISKSRDETMIGTVDWIMIADMLIIAPLREELMFRAIVFCIFYVRLGDDTPRSKIQCAIGSAAVFGLIHCLNMLGVRYQSVYIMLQVALGIELGLFYALEYARTESIYPTIIMHMTNNLYSSFISVDQELDLTDPLIAIPLAQTAIVYGVLIWISIRKLYGLGNKPFTPIDGDELVAAEIKQE